VAAVTGQGTAPAPGRARRRRGGWGYHAVMLPVTLLWVAPMIFVVLVAIRSFDDIAGRGLGALPASFSLQGFTSAFTDAQLGPALRTSILLTAPAVLVALALASMGAFALSRYRLPMRRTILLVMLAGNLLPPQVLLIPVAKMSENLGIYDTIIGLVAIHVGFGLGFYTFVLHGFMRSLPRELTEAAVIDGAGPMSVYARIVLPLTRPALAALGALATTWIYNDLIWALTILRTEAKFPVTAALLNLSGGYVSSWNLVAAGTLIAALPTAVVFFAFQRHFVAGLLVGSSR
jgi:multiple sugar transport system permease protein